MKSVCGADCDNCGYGKAKTCKGCIETNSCPFGKKCFIGEYIKIGGTENYNSFKKSLINEFNSLNIPCMAPIDDLFPLNGAFVNLAYPMPSGNTVKLLDDNQIYLGNQVLCEFDDGEGERCFGLVAGRDFLLVAEYGENGTNPEIIIFKKR